MELQKEAKIELAPNLDYLLITQIRRILRSSGYAAFSQIRVTVIEGDVSLEGQVSTYFLKQVAQTLILSLEEVKTLNNDLVVEARFNQSV